MPPLPRLLVITDGDLDERIFASPAIRSVVAVQYRAPTVTDRVFLSTARALKARCDAFAVPFFVNGRVDVALLVGAHLHLPAHGLQPIDARAQLGTGRWLSAAVHDEAEAIAAAGVDLALVSPVFGAGSKPLDQRPVLGVEGFERIARVLSCPAYALGGIDPSTVGGLVGSSAHGVAVVSALQRAADPAAVAAALVHAWT